MLDKPDRSECIESPPQDEKRLKITMRTTV